MKRQCDMITGLAADMQYKLDKNRFKPCPFMSPEGEERHWEHLSILTLIKRIKDETRELEGAFMSGDWREVQLECADVANFAGMIHDNVREYIHEEEKS